MVLNSMPLVLTGTTTAILATFIYTITDSGFIVNGSYKGKEEALVIYLGTVLVLGIINPFIYRFWVSTQGAVDATVLLGLGIATGMYLVNEKVTNWKQTDKKSISIYLISAGIIYL